MGKARALEQRFISSLPVGLSEMTAPVEKAVRIQPDNPWGLVTLARMTFNYQVRPDPAEKLALPAGRLGTGLPMLAAEHTPRTAVNSVSRLTHKS